MRLSILLASPILIGVLLASHGKALADITLSQSSDDPAIAAKVGKELIPSLAKDDRRAQELGFLNALEASNANSLVLGEPFPVYRLGLRLLRSYQGEDPQLFLERIRKGQPKRFIYPILIGENVRSAVTVRKAEKNTVWQPTQWGDAVVIQQLSAIRQQNQMRKATSMLAVWVPAFQRYYLIDEGEKPFRIFPTRSSDPLLEDSSLDLGVGLPSKPANLIKILTKLKEEALALNEEEGVR